MPHRHYINSRLLFLFPHWFCDGADGGIFFRFMLFCGTWCDWAFEFVAVADDLILFLGNRWQRLQILKKWFWREIFDAGRKFWTDRIRDCIGDLSQFLRVVANHRHLRVGALQASRDFLTLVALVVGKWKFARNDAVFAGKPDINLVLSAQNLFLNIGAETDALGGGLDPSLERLVFRTASARTLHARRLRGFSLGRGRFWLRRQFQNFREGRRLYSFRKFGN